MLQQSEARLQQECFMWFHNTYPHLRGLFFRIKNEDHNPITGARNKATGVIPGVSDSCFLAKTGAKFIEFKIPGGRQSKDQKEWSSKIIEACFDYFIVYSLDEFKDLCQKLVL
jgi:hypothetical protein